MRSIYTQHAVLLPNTLTSVEQGYPTSLAFNWFGVMAPAKTPQPIVDKLYAALARAASSPELVEAMRKVGVEPFVQPSPKAFGEFLQKETDRWGVVARASGAKSD